MRAHDRTPSFFRCWLRPVLVGVAVGLIGCIGLLMLMALVVCGCGLVIGVVAQVLGMLVLEAATMREENDLTI